MFLNFTDWNKIIKQVASRVGLFCSYKYQNNIFNMNRINIKLIKNYIQKKLSIIMVNISNNFIRYIVQVYIVFLLFKLICILV